MLWLLFIGFFFFFKQKTAYEMRISDWSSDVCSSDLVVILEGINDIGNSGRRRPDGTTAPPISYEQLIDGYRELVASAHRRGIKAIGMTILPFEGANYHTDAGEAMGMRVNDWQLGRASCRARVSQCV